MKIKSYVAADMRSAMRQVREELGPDAVILSTRQVNEGVELSAAVDHGEAMEQNWNEAMALRFAAAAREEAEALQEQALAHSDQQAFAHEAMNSDVSEELKSLRGLLEQQLAALAWNDYTRREPHRAQALQTLTRIGLARDIARIIADELPAALDADQAQRMPLALLARSIAVCADPSSEGGVLALVGPPGSGKTTTLAKLAVRWLLEQPQGTLAIISADEQRIGSHEQLRALGRLIGVPVHVAANATQLAEQLELLCDKQLVLIDTPGVGARDDAGIAELSELCAASEILRKLLVLPASAQGGVLEETVLQYSRIEPACAVLTRMDEAALLGGALSALVRSQLPLALISEGTGIPEDLRPARSHQLVARAVELSRNANESADEDLLAHRYGGSRHVAA